MNKVRIVVKTGGVVAISMGVLALVTLGVFLAVLNSEKSQFKKQAEATPTASSSPAPSPEATSQNEPAPLADPPAKLPDTARPLTQWLVLRPVPSGVEMEQNLNEEQRKARMAQVLGKHQIPDEARLDPRSGSSLLVGKEKISWIPVTGAALDLTTAAAFTTAQNNQDNAVGYAVTELIAPAATTNATLYLGSDDGVVVWLNGKEVHRNATVRGCNPADDKVSHLSLKAGRNVLVFKVGQDGGEWRLDAAIDNI